MFYPSGRIKQVEGWMKPNPGCTIYSSICLFLKYFDKRHTNYALTKMVKYMLYFKYIVSLSFKFLTFIFVLRLLIILICFKLHLLHPVYKTLTPRIHVIIAYWKTYSYVTYVRLRKKSTVSICFKWPISERGKIIPIWFYIVNERRLLKSRFCSGPSITINVVAKANICMSW